MAATEVRFVRRSRQPHALTAASQIVSANDEQYKSKVAFSGRTGWQTEAWTYLDEVGELRYYVSWRSNACSRVRLIASELDESGKPTGKCSNEEVNAIINGIAGGQLGQAQMVKRAIECLSVPGETFIGVFPKPEPEDDEWLAFSKDEVKKQGKTVSVTMPNGQEYKLGPQDTLFRVWQPHPRLAKDADSPVRASRSALNEIVRATKTIAAATKSRLIGNGIVFVPQEMSLPAAPAPIAGNRPVGTATPLSLTGDPAVNELTKMLAAVAKKSYEDPDSAAALLPIFATVPGEAIKSIMHLKLGEDVNKINLETRNEGVARLALGLEVSPERLLGLGSTTNHWSAWSIGDTDVQMHIAPVMELLVAEIYRSKIKDVFIKAGIDPRQYVLWYDASGLTADPDVSDRAQDAFDRRAITAAAYRDFANLGESGYDFESLDGWKQWAQDTVAEKPELIGTLLPLLDPKIQQFEFPLPALPSQQDPGTADDTNEGNDPDTADNEPGDDQGKRGRPSEVARADPLVELLVNRALELAGKRRRTRKSDYDRLRSIPMHRTHRAMGPVERADIPDLIKGWEDAVTDEVLAMLPDYAGIRAVVLARVVKELTAEVIDG